jgi:hypothetical protein
MKTEPKPRGVAWRVLAAVVPGGANATQEVELRGQAEVETHHERVPSDGRDAIAGAVN